MNHFKTFILVILTAAVLTLTGGCQPASRPVPEAQAAVAPAIVTECIAGYYQKDSAPYITEQQHDFAPSARYVQIVANEPTGRYRFTLNDGRFTQSDQPTPFLSGLPASFVNEPLAVAIFYSFTAGAGLLDTTPMSAVDSLRIEGQWYQPLPVSDEDGIAVTLLRNIDTNRIDRVKVQDAATGADWLCQSYNLRYSQDLGGLVPRKIDVFDIQSGLASKRLIIQFEYKSVLKSQK